MRDSLLAAPRAASPRPAVPARGTLRFPGGKPPDPTAGTPDERDSLLAAPRAASPRPAVLARGTLRFPGGKPPDPTAGTPD
jgi:hypothetical protein